MTTLHAPAAGPRRVLILHSHGREFAPFSIISATFRTELARQSPEPLEFYEASMEASRYEEAATDGPLVDYLQTMFAERQLDLIMTTAEPSSLFMARNRSQVFPDAPLVAVVNQRMISAMAGTTNTTIVPVYIELPVLIENILQVLPATTNVVMVLGKSPFELYWTEQCQREFAPFTNRVAVNYANELTFDQIRTRVANLPPQSAVLYGMLAMDAAGVPYEQERALSDLRAVANAPVFGVLEHHLGKGIVGGRLVSMEALGREAARAGLALLRHEQPADIRPTAPAKPVYDWRELRRWNINESSLPPGSEVRFRVPSFWEQYKWQLIAIHTLCLAEGLLIFILLRNRRRLRRTQSELRQSEERLSMATTSAKVGVWSWKIASGDIEATPEAKRMFGWEANEPVTFPMFLARLHPDDRAAVQESVDRALQSQAIYDIQYRIVLPAGQTRWISARGRAQYENGSPVNMLGVLLDVTEREQAQIEAQRQRAELAHVARVSTMGELAASVAHELNQPLGAILSNAEAAEMFLQQDPPALTDVREILTDIRKDDERAGEVIRRMRALLRKREMEMLPLDLNSVVEDVFRLISGDAALRKTTLTAELAPRLPAVLGDRVHLQQVLLNLTMNALEAMARQPAETRRLMVRTRINEDGTVEAEVTDTGPGIEADKLPHVFEPFFTTKPSGMGMGLSIARRIIEAHQGHVSAANNTSGGATFRVTLPSPAEELKA
ncbi:MAG: PAS domain-containing protein [Verrucomicrobiae bacterium]|nr:PAS domain-containing protein [Verrucomicrobiae bacterium]